MSIYLEGMNKFTEKLFYMQNLSILSLDLGWYILKKIFFLKSEVSGYFMMSDTIIRKVVIAISKLEHLTDLKLGLSK